MKDVVFVTMLLAVIVLVQHHRILDWTMKQWRSEPAMEIEDAYKWLFQAQLGGEHAVAGVAEARTWLRQEWKTLSKPLPGEPILVFLTPDHRLARLNLRPFRSGGGTQEQALDYFVRSAHGFQGRRETFVREWSQLGVALRSSRLGRRFAYRDWQKVDRAERTLGYPAIDHSAGYERTCHPAYRVVLTRFLPPDLWNHKARR